MYVAIMRTVKIGIAVVMHPAALWLYEGVYLGSALLSLFLLLMSKVAFTHFVASVLGW